MKLINGDCLEEMKKMEDESIDMILTSPPYDNLRTYNDSLNWNFEIFKNIAKECSRVLKKGGVIVWVVGDATVKGSETGSSFRQALYFKDDCGLNLHDTMIWNKPNFSMPSKTRYHQIFEYMFVFSKGKPKTFNPIIDRKNKYSGKTCLGRNTYRKRDGTFGENKTKGIINEFGMRMNVWNMNTSGQEKMCQKQLHPATFPEKLAKDHILSWSNEGDIILDPFMGSGTVGKMCKLNNREFIGIELVKEYYDIAVKRIDEAINKFIGIKK